MTDSLFCPLPLTLTHQMVMAGWQLYKLVWPCHFYLTWDPLSKIKVLLNIDWKGTVKDGVWWLNLWLRAGVKENSVHRVLDNTWRWNFSVGCRFLFVKGRRWTWCLGSAWPLPCSSWYSVLLMEFAWQCLLCMWLWCVYLHSSYSLAIRATRLNGLRLLRFLFNVSDLETTSATSIYRSSKIVSLIGCFCY